MKLPWIEITSSFGSPDKIFYAMDYYDAPMEINESELEYARWYSQLPAARKAVMLCDMFQFGMDSVRYNARKKNPYATEAETMLCYFEKNLKNSFPPEVFEFIREKMMEKAEMEWETRFKAMKKHLDWTYEDIARFIQTESGSSVKPSVNRKLPAMAKLAVCVFEAMEKKALPHKIYFETQKSQKDTKEGGV